MSIRILISKFTSRKPIASYVRIFLASVLYTFAIQSFLNIGGTFSTGMGAFSQLFTFVIKNLNDYFSIIYIAVNIPLIIFFWSKSKKSFMYRTTFFLLIQAGIGSLYLIPYVHESLTNLMNLKGNNPSDTDTIISRTEKPWAILIYALVGAAIMGISQVMCWKAGGSTAGTDFIGYYYSTKRHQAIGNVLFKIAIIIAIFSIVVTLAINPESMHARENWLMLLVSTFGYTSITSSMMNLLYPKYSKVRLEIHSEKYLEIIDNLKTKGFAHAYNLQQIQSGYTGKTKTSITSVVLLLEVKEFIKRIHEIDPNVWISETRVRRVFGSFSTKAVE